MAKKFNIISPFNIEWVMRYECLSCKNVIEKKESTSDISVIPDKFNVSNEKN